jgi:RNA polymerase sigma-70 factor (ECF subfamily)
MVADVPQDMPPDRTPLGAESATPDFLRLFATHQPQIFAYILSLLPNWDDAQEVLQETCVVLWKSFGSFTPGTNFRAWASQAAFHQVLSFRKRQKRVPMPLSDAFLQAVAQETEALADPLEAQLRALSTCIEKLRPHDAALLRQCYEPGASTKIVAKEVGRPAGTIYKALTRIRRTLFACIQQTLAAEERT